LYILERDRDVFLLGSGEEKERLNELLTNSPYVLRGSFNRDLILTLVVVGARYTLLVVTGVLLTNDCDGGCCIVYAVGL